MINPIFKYPKYNVSFCANRTYVIGHKNPDSDSVCSAIGQAYLENAIKIENAAVSGCVKRNRFG